MPLWQFGGKVPESDAQSVHRKQTPSTGLRHPSKFSYAIGSRKLSANEQFFVGGQTVVSLLQTTQIKQGVSFIAANKVYTSTNKTTIGVDASHVYVRALALGCFYSHISTHIPSIAFRHLPPNSARFSYATEGHSLSPRSCPATRSAPSERFGY